MKKVISTEKINKIYKIGESDKLTDSEIRKLKKLNFDWLVYYYRIEDYEGNGFAIWKKNKKYYYHDMYHCSCYGPVEKMADNSPHYNKLDDIKKFADKYNYGREVLEFIKEKKLK